MACSEFRKIQSFTGDSTDLFENGPNISRNGGFKNGYGFPFVDEKAAFGGA